MKLRELFTSDVVNLKIESESKDDILKELIGLLGMDSKSEAILFKTLKRRENLGSTGIGKGIAIPFPIPVEPRFSLRLRVLKRIASDFESIPRRPMSSFRMSSFDSDSILRFTTSEVNSSLSFIP